MLPRLNPNLERYLESKLRRCEELERQLQDPEIISDPQKFIPLQREHGGLAKVASAMRDWKEREQDIQAAQAMLDEASDDDEKEYARAERDELINVQKALKRQLEDIASAGDSLTRSSCIMEIRAGTGGDEAALFAGNLLEMYKRFIDRKGWKYEVIEAQPTELGGIKEAILSVSGDGAFHRLQFESGGHRVQRVPETETQGRIHTSAATVAVLPEPTEVELNISADELRIDKFHASGPGGQKVNKTESAIRITHLPTGIVVQCQDEKSQHKNKAKAMRVLKSRVLEAKQQEEAQKRATQRRGLIGSGDRSQRIRTYNFPERRVTDHRIGLSLYKLDQIMLGELDELLQQLLDYDRQQRLEAQAEQG